MKWMNQRGHYLNRLAGVGVLLAGLIAPGAMAEIVIVESRTGGLNFDRYAEEGSWNNYNLAKSSAPGCTPGIGARYAGTGTPAFTVSPTLALAGGTYKVSVTLPTQSNCSTSIVVDVVAVGGTGLPADTTLFQRTSPAQSPNWADVGTLTLNPGVTLPSVTFRYQSGSLTTSGSRFYADAVRFEQVVPCTVTISQPPANASVPEESDAHFTVVATGTGTLSYAWTVGGAPAGTNSPSLTLTNVQLAQNGAKVAVTVTDSNCSKLSPEATLNVLPLPVIQDPPDNVSVTEGGTANFNVVATGTGTLHYEWRRQRAGSQTSEVVGTDSASLSLTNVGAIDNNAKIWVKVTDNNGSRQSAQATLTVTSALAIQQPPRSTSVAVGNKAYFQVTATGAPPLHYQWYRQRVGEPAAQLVGTDSPVLVLDNAQLADHNAKISVRVTDASTFILSPEVILTVVVCNAPYADADGDDDIDQIDYAAFQACYTSAMQNQMMPGYCACFDMEPAGGDGDVDQEDLSLFEQYATGPTIPYVAELVINNQPDGTTVGTGATAAFAVGTTGGSGTLQYQWYVANVPSGPNSSGFQKTNCQLADNGKQVHVVVTDLVSGTVKTSSAAVLTVVACHYPYADYDNDLDVDGTDYGVFLECYTGPFPGPWLYEYCHCFDRDPAGSDGDVDADDLDQFANCITGPNIQWTPAAHPDCMP